MVDDSFPGRYLQIDEEGYWLSEGLRISDEEYGQELLRNLRRDDRGRFLTHDQNLPIAVESFDDPLVVRTLESDGDRLIGGFPYGWCQALDLATLSVDEWDRFHGRLENGVPFVMSRAAQAALFNLVDSFDDEGITWRGKRFAISPWLNPTSNVNDEGFWSDVYRAGTPDWDLGRESTVLPAILPQLKLPRSRILVLGCGTGSDAAFFADQGHIVTGVDFSPEAIARAREKYAAKRSLRFIQQDLFVLPKEWTGQFDVVFEHTCYCAVLPERRNELVGVWRRVLAERGHVLGVFFARDKTSGPPWGGSEWEIRQRLKPFFDFRYWTRWRHSIPRRQGYELVVWAQKRS